MVVPKKLWPLWMASAAAAAASPSVTVDAGTILGGQCGSGNSVFYKAIPYADPPVRGLRFEAPKAYGKYPGGRLNATAPAPACIQFGDTFKALGKTSEDCLYLDIWTPADATEDSKLPVKVFVFGGSNIEGGISDTLYDGCNTADDGAILVSINYRLGPLGFMALESAGIHGNQGIQDLLLGLKWVKNSISAFGGDSDKIVLFGQSAGATDAYIISALPDAPSLINSAIAESVALPSLASNSSVQTTSVSYAKSLKCDVRDKKCLEGKSTIDLRSVYFSDEYLKTGLGAADVTIPSVNSHKFWPYVDGTVIPEAPSAVGAKVPAIFGYNQREGMMDTLTKYNSTEAAASATPAAYTKFLKDNFGPAAAIIEKYYDLSLFQSTPLPVIAAISTVATDAEYKCPAYASAAQTVRNNVPAWVYEFTHNSTCVWLDTMPQAFIDVFGAAHTAELPYVFGNLHFDFADKNSSCTGTSDEWSLSKEMMGLWTAMAEKGNPSTNDIHWPEFRATTNGSDVQGMVFGNFSRPGAIDFSVCELWAKIDALLGSTNVTASAPSGGAIQPTSSRTGRPTSLASAPVVVCDRQRPSCGQCLRLHGSCPGYRDEWELVFRDQTKQTVEKHKVKSAKVVAGTMLAPNRMNTSVEEMGVNYFLRHFVNGGNPHSRGCLNYIPINYSPNAESPILLKSMAAVGLMALAKSTSHFELAGSAQRKYVEAVHMVNSALESPTESLEDSTLMAVISLGVFEEISDYKSWVIHVQGAAALLVARGKEQFSSPMALKLFNQVRTDLITACVNENNPVPEDVLALQDEGKGHQDVSSSFWQIGLVGARCAKLLTNFKGYNIEIVSDLLYEANTLEQEFGIFGQLLSLEEPYSTIQDTAGRPDLICHGRIGVYEDMWAIRIWNNWRNLLMIVCRVKLFLLNEILMNALAPDNVGQTKLQLRDTMQLLAQLGEGILATLPQAMKFQVTTYEDQMWNDGASGLSSVASAYLLAGRLSVVGQSEATNGETRQWIIQRLTDISKSARIPTALKIIEAIKGVDVQ